MRRCITALLLFVVFFAVYTPSIPAAEVLRIHIPEAYLLEGPGTGYPLLCKITRGESLILLSWDGNWFRVRRTNGVVGWLNRVTLSPEDSARYPGNSGTPAPGSPAPTKADPSGTNFLDSIRTGFNGGHDDSLTASAGGRGIITETDSGNCPQDFRAVQFMESIVISDDDLSSFITSGGLNP